MEKLADIATQLSALADRVAALESARSDPRPRSPLPAAGEPDLELIERLRSRSDPEFTAETTAGSVLYAGAATVASGSYVWQMERPVPGLLQVDDDLVAHTLAALASPTRVRLVKAVLGGARQTHELQEALGGVSTGQLYHHLKELTAVGLLIQRGRGQYEVPAQSVVPFLAVVAAAYDLAGAPTDDGSDS